MATCKAACAERVEGCNGVSLSSTGQCCFMRCPDAEGMAALASVSGSSGGSGRGGAVVEWAGLYGHHLSVTTITVVSGEEVSLQNPVHYPQSALTAAVEGNSIVQGGREGTFENEAITWDTGVVWRKLGQII